MEPAATLPKKKTLIHKGQLKKTIKNILCRPDPQTWFIVPDDEAETLDILLQKHKVLIPHFKKPHWNKVKDLPKEQRPKSPKLPKVNGLFFGISECSNALHKNECSAIILESTINPRVIVQSVTELCTTNKIPYVCLKDLRKICAKYYGIPTCCLGLSNSVPELTRFVSSLAIKLHSYNKVSISKSSTDQKVTEVPDIEMCDLNTNVTAIKTSVETPITKCPYLYRTNSKTRVFVPIQEQVSTKRDKKFSGQDFIVFDKNSALTDNDNYKDMLLKRIGSNPKRKSGKLKLKKNK